MVTSKPPAPQGISALLKRAGFERSDTGQPGVMWHEASTGFSVWKTFHGNAPRQPYVAVQHHIRDADRSDEGWPGRQQEMRAMLDRYAEVLRTAGYPAFVRDRGKEPPWLTILTVVTAGKPAEPIPPRQEKG